MYRCRHPRRRSPAIPALTGQSSGCAGGQVLRKIGFIDWELDQVR
jgi:hypothetical protein